MSLSISIEQHKKNASYLLRDLKSPNSQTQKKAAQRFSILKRLPHQDKEEFQLKHALTVVALEAGYTSWVALKQELEPVEKIDFKNFFGNPCFGGSTNFWARSYKEAKNYQSQKGGFIFPYRSHFFVAEEGFIESLGLANDPDWNLIGKDWIHPKCPHAWYRLQSKLAQKY